MPGAKARDRGACSPQATGMAQLTWKIVKTMALTQDLSAVEMRLKSFREEDTLVCRGWLLTLLSKIYDASNATSDWRSVCKDIWYVLEFFAAGVDAPYLGFVRRLNSGILRHRLALLSAVIVFFIRVSSAVPSALILLFADTRTRWTSTDSWWTIVLMSCPYGHWGVFLKHHSLISSDTLNCRFTSSVVRPFHG